MRRSLQKLQFGAAASRRIPPLFLPHIFYCRRHLSAVFTPPLTALLDVVQETQVDSGKLTAKAYKVRQLAGSLSLGFPDPSLLWRNYMDLMNLMEYEMLPLEIHQAVLRKCTVSTSEIRASTARNLQQKSLSYRRPFHVHEARFRAVIRNIRAAGDIPSLDDFHFILQHFAAAGHYLGVQSVMSELLELGLSPTYKTYGLCLQALAHRLALPFPYWDRPSLVAQLSVICNELLSDMSKRGIPITSVNLDLVVRVLRESRGEEGLSKLLKLGYGIDLAYLDQPPLMDNTLETLAGATSENPGKISAGPSHVFQPFSTHALNTVIDILGRMGHLSRMVAVFETITKPLPPPSDYQNSFPSPFEDDEEDDSPIRQTRRAWKPPHSEPNTTTFNMLIKYAAKERNVTLARHYAEQTFDAEHCNHRRIRNAIRNKRPMNEIIASSVAVSRETLLPIYGKANRDNDIELLRWVRNMCKKALRWKNKEMKHLHVIKDRLAQQSVENASVVLNTADTVSNDEELVNYSLPIEDTPAHDTDAFSPILDADVETLPTLEFAPLPPSTFNLDLHLAILRRDITEIDKLKKRTGDHLHRNIQRTKQRLGRRVWSGKDIYVVGQEQRVSVSQEDWQKMVNFHTDKSLNREK